MWPMLVAQVVGSAMQNQAIPAYQQPQQDNTGVIIGGIIGVLAVGGLIYLVVKH